MCSLYEAVCESVGNNYGRVVPKEVIDDMLDALPDSFWRGSVKILDINYTCPMFLDACHDRLSKYHSESDIKGMLFGYTQSGGLAYISEIIGSYNLTYPESGGKFISVDNIEEDLAMTLHEVEFDLVIGNPPYNNGIYIDFMSKAIKLAQYVSLIVPAKWVSREGAVDMREAMNSHLRSVTFYPESVDVFSILSPGGVLHYLYDKNYTGQTELVNHCSPVPAFNGREVCDFSDYMPNLFGRGVLSKLGDYKSFTFPTYVEDKRYGVYITNMPGYGGGSASKNFYSKVGNTQVLCRYDIIDMTSESYSARQSRCCFTSDSREECESYVSYIYSKFVRFLVLIGIDRTAFLCDTVFRFVPEPPAYDHIYTDAELYAQYGLTEEQIAVIESVIRERK